MISNNPGIGSCGIGIPFDPTKLEVVLDKDDPSHPLVSRGPLLLVLIRIILITTVYLILHKIITKKRPADSRPKTSRSELFFLLGCKGAPDNGAKGTTDERGDDEHPEILQGLTASEEGGTD